MSWMVIMLFSGAGVLSSPSDYRGTRAASGHGDQRQQRRRTSSSAAAQGSPIQVTKAPNSGSVRMSRRAGPITESDTEPGGRPPDRSPNICACHSGETCLRLYPEVPVLRMVVVKRVMNRHRVRMLRMRVSEVVSAAVTGVALSAPCGSVRAVCRGHT